VSTRKTETGRIQQKQRWRSEGGTRRLDWGERAVGGLRQRLKLAACERVLPGLALCIGIEAMLVSRDIRGLPGPQATEAGEWLAPTALRATPRESRHDP